MKKFCNPPVAEGESFLLYQYCLKSLFKLLISVVNNVERKLAEILMQTFKGALSAKIVNFCYP